MKAPLNSENHNCIYCSYCGRHSCVRIYNPLDITQSYHKTWNDIACNNCSALLWWIKEEEFFLPDNSTLVSFKKLLHYVARLEKKKKATKPNYLRTKLIHSLDQTYEWFLSSFNNAELLLVLKDFSQGEHSILTQNYFAFQQTNSKVQALIKANEIYESAKSGPPKRVSG